MDIKNIILFYFAIFASCIGGKDHLLQKNIINDQYKLIFSSLYMDLKYDTTNIQFNDIDYYVFKSFRNEFEFHLYIGRQDPPVHWKNTFNFDLDKEDLREEVESFIGNYFIESNTYYFKDRVVKSVTYIQDNQLLKIESRFLIMPDLVVNSVLLQNLKNTTEFDLVNYNKRLLQEIKIERNY